MSFKFACPLDSNLRRDPLVWDIVQLILDNCVYECGGPVERSMDARYADLARFARISNVWLGPVRRCLFTRPMIASYAASAMLARTCVENSDIGRLVHELYLRIDQLREVGRRNMPLREDAPCKDTPNAGVCTLLQHLPKLSLLRLDESAVWDAEHYLRAVPFGNSILTLEIDGTATSLAQPHRHRDYEGLILDWVTDLTLRSQNLKVLRLKFMSLRVCCELDRPAVVEENIRGFELEELALEDTRIPKVSKCLASLTDPRSWSRLRVLKLCLRMDYDSGSRIHLKSFLDIPLDALEHLICMPIHDTSVVFDGLQSLSVPSLRRLDIATVTLHAPSLTRDIPRLFPNVEHFVTGLDTELISAPVWIQLVDCSALKRLGAFSAMWYRRNWSPTNEAEFRASCTRRGVSHTITFF